MAESSDLPVCVRYTKLNQILQGKVGKNAKSNHLTKDALMDALIVLHGECNNTALKSDKYIASFARKYNPTITHLKELRVNLSDFEIKKVIGRGHFGEVHLVQEKQTGDVYAMKRMKKFVTLAADNAASYAEERDIMAKANSPWITALRYAFQDEHRLYLVMEFHPGGNLLSLLDKFDGSLPEDMARFYIAEIILALRTLHDMGYAHRDIKPENILLDRCGHIKLADFGSAAKLSEQNYVESEVPSGTPDYLAPEMLDAVSGKKRYGPACDFWSLGVLAYELVYGVTPFRSERVTSVYANILKHKQTLKFPEEPTISANFRSLITGLVCEEEERLTYDQLTKHPVFETIDWTGIREGIPPYVPQLSSQEDTSNFEEFEHISSLNVLEECLIKKGFSGKNLPFIGFSYVQNNQEEVKRKPGSETSRILELEASLESRKKQIIQLLQTVDGLKSSKPVDTNLVDQLRERMKVLEKETDELHKKNASCSIELSDCKLALEMEKMKHKRYVVESQEKSKKTQEEIKEAVKNKVERMEKDYKELEDAYLGLESEVKRKEQELEIARPQFVKLKEAYGKLKIQAKKYQALAMQGNKLLETRRSISEEPGVPLLTPSATSEQLKQVNLQLRKQQDANVNLELQLEALKASETQLNIQLSEAKLDHETHLEERVGEWQSKYANLQQKYEDLDAKTTAKRKELESKVLFEKEARIQELEAKLKAEVNDCKVLKTRIKDMEKTLSDSELSLTLQESSFGSKEAEMEKLLVQREAELRAVSQEKQALAQELSNTKDIHDENRQKIDKFETLVKQLVEKIAEAEKCTRTSIPASAEVELQEKVKDLEAQVQKLEGSLEKARENLTLEKQSTRDFRSDAYKKERELNAAQLDLRIAQRALKSAESKCETLQSTHEAWETKVSEKEKQLTQMEEDRNRLSEKITALEQTVADKSASVSQLEHKLEMRQSLYSEKTKDLQQAVGSVDGLKAELKSAKEELTLIQRQKLSMERELIQAEEKLKAAIRSQDELRKTLDEERLEHHGLQENYEHLKEICTELETQMRDYDLVLEKNEGAEKKFEAEKNQLAEQILQLKEDVKAAKRVANEEKSMKIFHEKKAQDLETRLKATETSGDEQVQLLKSQLNKYVSMAQDYGKQVNQLSSELSDAEIAIERLGRDIGHVEEDKVALQEESTALRTQLVNVKEHNFTLSQALEEAVTKLEAYKEKLGNMEALLEQEKKLARERDFKDKGTIAQQTKLIDYLQALTNEHSKKKKTLGDKLFGQHKKENVAPAAMSLNYREMENQFQKERLKNRTLTEQLDKARAEIVSLNMGPQIAESSGFSRNAEARKSQVVATPQTQRVLTRLAQSPGAQSPSALGKRPTKQRMHHNIPHRFDTGLNMKATHCAVCLDSIHFGRQVATCSECHTTAHPKCAPELPSTCGLPSEFAVHFIDSMAKSSTSSSESNESDKSVLAAAGYQGWVKIPKSGKASWEKKYMVLDGTNLHIYDQELQPNLAPVDSLDLCPDPNLGSTTIHGTTSSSEVIHAVKSDLAFVFKVDVASKTTCWPGRTLYVMALNFEEKKRWVSSLQTALSSRTQISTPVSVAKTKLAGSVLLHFEREQAVEINCVAAIGSHHLLLGSDEGLFSCRLDKGQPSSLVRIEGVDCVYQISLVPALGFAFMIAGRNRQLVRTELSVLQSSAAAAACAKPAIQVECLQGMEACHLFSVFVKNAEEAFLCAATADLVEIMTWYRPGSTFVSRKKLTSEEPCNCIHFAQHSVLIGCDRFFEIDLKDFSASEFLDASDQSLNYVVFDLKKQNSFPVAILDVTSHRGGTEYLLCYNEFGIFVDSYGRRSRPADFKWKRLPLAFAYCKPYIYIWHLNSVEVIQLSSKAYTLPEGDVSDNLDDANAYLPPRVVLELNKPHYLGPAVGEGAVYVSTSDSAHAVTEVLRLQGDKILQHRGSLESLSTIQSLEGDLDSLVDFADQLDPRMDSTSLASSGNDSLFSGNSASRSNSGSKRPPASADPNGQSGKRVKFEMRESEL